MSSDGNGAKHNEVLQDALRSVTQAVTARPRVTLWLVLLFAFVCVGLTVNYLDFKTKRSDLIDPTADFHQRWMDYTKEFGEESDIIVVVEGGESDFTRQVLEELGSRFTRETELYSNVLYKVNVGAMSGQGLQNLTPRQLELGLRRLNGYQSVINGSWKSVSLANVYSQLRYQISKNQSRSSHKNVSALLEHSDLLTSSMLTTIETPKKFKNPWPSIVPVDSRMKLKGYDSVYFMNDSGSMGFLKVLPTASQNAEDFNGKTKAIDRAREIAKIVSEDFDKVKISLTGIPVLENDEMRRSQSDMVKASVISLAGVSFILLLGFRGFRHPALAIVMLLLAMAWSFGFTTLFVGHLNILSVSFAVILIGLGIDFAIHYLSRYLQNRHEGENLSTALENSSATVGTGIITAAITTALAFFCATFTDFLGVAELGIIAGGGIIICAIATFVILPALITLADKGVEPKKLPTPLQGKILRAITSKAPFMVALFSILVIGGIGSRALIFHDHKIESRVKYDTNLINLQAEGLESVEIQKRIFNETDRSVLFAVAIANSPRQARVLKAKFEALPSVRHVDDLASRISGNITNSKQRLITRYQNRLATLPSHPGSTLSPSPRSIGKSMESLHRTLKRRKDAQSHKIAKNIALFLKKFDELEFKTQVSFLKFFEKHSMQALYGQFQAIREASKIKRLELEDFPHVLVSRFVSEDKKKWLLKIYPKEQIWDAKPLEQFVTDVRTVDENVTGTPVQNYEAAMQIKESYKKAALYALAVICIVLLLDFLHSHQKWLTLLPPLVVVIFAAMTMETRGTGYSPALMGIAYAAMVVTIGAVLDFKNMRNALLSMFPPLAGGFMMFGLMAIFKVDLNPANLIVLPLILGIGVDDGVHVVHDFRQQMFAKKSYQTSSSTINAIMLTSFTSMVGFGSMMIAAHRGLFTVGLVLVIGVGSCLFVSLVALPAILTMISRAENPQLSVSKKTAPVKSGGNAALQPGKRPTKNVA